MTTPDVTVMGAGIFGLACAWEMARRGARVRVIETARIGAGASGGVVGALAPHVPGAWNPKKQFQFDSLLMAGAFWDAVRKTGEVDPGYARSGRLQAIADAAALEQARSRATEAARLWQGQAAWHVEPLPGADWQPLAASGWMIRDTLSARIAPRAALAALVAAIRALGGEVIEGSGPPEGAVLWATGVAGLAEMSATFGKPVGGAVKGQAARLGFDAGRQPQLFVDGLHIVPHADGTVAVGSTSERVYSGENAITPHLDDLIGRARAAVPILSDAPVIERWAGLRPRAASRAPMLGAWPGRAGHFVANGGFKIGFGMAPKAAAVMADLILAGRDAIPDGFRVEDNF